MEVAAPGLGHAKRGIVFHAAAVRAFHQTLDDHDFQGRAHEVERGSGDALGEVAHLLRQLGIAPRLGDERA